MQRTHAPLLALTTLTALGLAAVQPAQAQTYTFTGTTVGGPTFNRPLAATPPTALSGVGTAVHYSVFTFTVTAAGSYVFQSTSVAPALWDNFTLLYGGAFTPTTPLVNALVANDDNPSIGLSGFTITLNTGTTYNYVTAGFANTDVGTFSDTIVGPGAVVAPEPTQTVAFGIGLLGLSGLALKARKRRTAA